MDAAVCAALGVWGSGAFADAVAAAAVDLAVEVVPVSNAGDERPPRLVTVAGGIPALEELRALVASGVMVRPGPAALALADGVTARAALAAAGVGFDSAPVGRHTPAVVAVVARRPSGWSASYPLVETVGLGVACRHVAVATAAIVPSAIERRARSIAVSIADGVNLAGAMAVELSLHRDEVRVRAAHLDIPPEVLAALGGCATSPAENHLRGVLDLPFGAVA